jgi:hypothetical protein
LIGQLSICDKPTNEGLQYNSSSVGGDPPALVEVESDQFDKPKGPIAVQQFRSLKGSVKAVTRFGSCIVVNVHTGPGTVQVSFFPLICQPYVVLYERGSTGAKEKEVIRLPL